VKWDDRVLPFAAHVESRALMTGNGALATTEPGTYALPAVRIRRCRFRRVVCVTVGDAEYDVHCLHPRLRVALPIGDMECATSVCNDCAADGIFRADED
jgi:hypothetical protein